MKIMTYFADPLGDQQCEKLEYKEVKCNITKQQNKHWAKNLCRKMYFLLTS